MIHSDTTRKASDRLNEHLDCCGPIDRTKRQGGDSSGDTLKGHGHGIGVKIMLKRSMGTVEEILDVWLSC